MLAKRYRQTLGDSAKPTVKQCIALLDIVARISVP